MEQNKVHLEDKLTTESEGMEAKCFLKIEKETNKKQTERNDKEYNMITEKNSSESDKDGSNRDSSIWKD